MPDNYRADDPRRLEARKKYAKTEKGLKAGNKAKREWCKRNPIKTKAAHKVNNAVKSGRLIKPLECECCNSIPTRLIGHHNDYNFPLEVTWLCTLCHHAWHLENGPGLNADS